MGDRVAVMDAGRLQQLGPPQALYDAPANLFVATFLGSPAMNVFDARVERDGDRLAVVVEGHRLPLADLVDAAHPALRARAGEAVVVGVRPEALDDAALVPDAPGDRVLEATVDLVEALGADLVVHTRIGSTRAAARLSPASGCRPGDVVKLVVDTARLHLFDPRTGASLRAPTAT